MSDFKVILPHGITNLYTNPSLGDGLTDWLSAVIVDTLATDDAVFGLYSAALTTGAGGGFYQVITTANVVYTLSGYIKMDAGGAIDETNVQAFFDTTIQPWDSVTHIGNDWYRCVYTGTATVGARHFGVWMLAAAPDIHVDGWQLEIGPNVSTYCDGDQPGCAWNGARDASTSARSGVSRAGGFVRDLEDDLNFDISAIRGAQVAQQRVNVDRFSILPGGSLNSIKINPRIMTMTGVVRGTTLADMHANKQELVAAILPDSYPQTRAGYQPVRLRYTGAAVEKEIAAHYHSRLEGNLNSREPCAWERLQIRWVSPSPFWYSVVDSAQLLDTVDGAGVLSAVARLRSTGQWSNLGAAVGAGAVWAITGDDTYIYYGGNFTNWYGDANADYIVRYNQYTATWSALATGLPNGQVNDMAVGPDGILYIVGTFLNAGGDANADFIAQWNGVAFSAVGVPNTGGITSIESIRFDLAGNLWVGGNFTNLAGIANADYIAFWDGAAWNAPAVGADATIFALGVHPNGDIYAAGAFANIGGVAAVRAAFWNGTAWAPLSTGLNGNGLEMAFSGDGTLYIVGAFTTAGGVTVNYVTSWNGTAFSSLGTGLNAQATAVNIGPDGMVYIGGNFTTAGGLTQTDDVAKWNGASWGHLDVLLGGVAGVRAIYTERQDPVIPTNYNIWLGSSTAAPSTWAGLTTVTNDGTEIAFPVFIVERTGGTSAKIKSLRNETTGKELLFDYDLLDGERLTVTLAPTAKSFVSNFFGARPDAIIAGSDTGDWSLSPGNNEITCFVTAIGGPTIVAHLQWRDQYNGVD